MKVFKRILSCCDGKCPSYSDVGQSYRTLICEETGEEIIKEEMKKYSFPQFCPLKDEERY